MGLVTDQFSNHQMASIDLTEALNPAIVPRDAGGHACADVFLPPSTYSVIPIPQTPSMSVTGFSDSQTIGDSVSVQFTAIGTGSDPTPTYGVASGTLPPGETLDAATGLLSGTPTTAGTYSFTIAASDGPSLSESLSVSPPLSAPVFMADTPSATAAVGVPYDYQFTASGYPSPTFTVESGSLPPGLVWNEATGELSGTPTTTGTYTFTVDSSNGVSPDAVTGSLTIVVSPPPAPVFTADSPPGSGTEGIAYSYQFAATGTPAPTFSVSSGSLPPGLTLDPSSGLLAGTPTSPGSFTFDVAASNGNPPDADSGAVTIVVIPSLSPVFTEDSPPTTATVGAAYSYQLAASGTPTPTFSVGSGALPAGLSLDSASGNFSGTPTAAGTFSLTVKASNGVTPDADTPTITIVVSPATLTASDDAYSVNSGTELDVSAPGVLASDSPPLPSMTLTALMVQDNALGTIQLRPDGSFSYVPPAGFTGIDSFTYEVRDSAGDISNAATVSVTVNAGGPPTPTSGTVSPADGATITGPTTISDTLNPPSGQTITSWAVSYHHPEDPTLVQLATGTGPNVSATFDPTLVRDGTYAINIQATASGGGVLEFESGVVVDGTYKPGHYSTTIQDMTVNAGSIPIQIQRTYDSTDKSQEDFGVGWSIGFSDFRIDTNGALGAGGWSDSSCGLFGGSECYSSSVPHVVTVTWPDGHVDKFDLTPAEGSATFFSNYTSAAFTAEAGTTDSLQAVDSDVVLDPSGNLYEGSIITGENGIYDPQQFILTARDGTQYTIDRHQGLLSEADPNGNTVTITPSGIQSSTGQSVTFNRDTENRISSIIGPTGTVNYQYSSAGDLTNVYFPNVSNQSYSYDSNHDLLSIAGNAQVVHTLQYDSSGRVIAVTDGDGHTTTISSNVAGHQQVFTDATGQLTTVNTYDDRGDLIEQDQTYGGHTVTTTATYDSLGDQLSYTDGTGSTSTAIYDSSGELLTSTDADGHTTTYTYNGFGEPLTVTDPTGAVTTYTYDTAGNLLTSSDPNGHTTTDTYDASGHLLTQTDPLGRTTTYTYDSTGQVATVTDPGGNVTKENHDPNSGLLTSVTNPDNAITSFTYDADGNPITMTDANGQVWSATHDAFDRVTSQTDPSGHTTTYTYDGAGNLVSTTDPDGQTITYTYDADSRLIQKVVPGAGTTTYTYDPLSRLVGAANSTAQLNFTYDNAGHLLTATTGPSATSSIPTSTFTYTYDPAGLETSVQGPGGTTTYGYDADQRLTSVTDPSSGAFSQSWDPASELTAITRPNNVNDAITYDAAGDLTSLHSTNGSTLLNQADYTYNTSGLVSSFTNTTGTTTYGYDGSGQLTSATYPSGSGLTNDTFTYDPVGNRTSSASSPAGSFKYDSVDQMLSDVKSTYSYDGEGDLLTKTAKADGSTTTYTWTAEHQLTGISYSDGSSSSFLYDPLGRLVQQVDGGTITRYAYDRQTIGAQYVQTNALDASFVDDPTTTNRPLEMASGGQRYYFLTDRQGSTTSLTTASGSVAASYELQRVRLGDRIRECGNSLHLYWSSF